jgi:hypothetical protein
LRQFDFLTLCEGEIAKSDERWRDVCIAAFVTGVFSVLTLLPSVDWDAAFKQQKVAPLVSAGLLFLVTGIGGALSLFFVVRCRRRLSPSAFSRVKQRIEDYFKEPGS